MDTNTTPTAPTPPIPNNTHEKNTGMAILAYLGILILVPFLTEAKNDPFVKFHMRQGLVLIISEVIVFGLYMIPILGWLAGWILSILNLVLIVIGILNVLSGKEKELPILGQFAKNFNF